MTIETTLLLTTSTALQGWFEARGASLKRGGQDSLMINEGSFYESPEAGELHTLAGRLISTMPYLASPTTIQMLSTMIANPYWISGGLLLANIIPSIVYALTEDKDSPAAEVAATVSSVMGIAMKALNLVMISLILGSSATPMGATAFLATTCVAAFSAASIVYTTVNSISTSRKNESF